MLSDEEKKAIEDFKECYEKDISRFEDFNTYTQYIVKRNGIILNLIEKQSKEIEELKENKGYHLGFIDGGIGKRYEMEDKIKARIEEYKKQIEKMEKDDIGIGFTLGKEWSDLKAKVEFGQSLLEKE